MGPGVCSRHHLCRLCSISPSSTGALPSPPSHDGAVMCRAASGSSSDCLPAHARAHLATAVAQIGRHYPVTRRRPRGPVPAHRTPVSASWRVWCSARLHRTVRPAAVDAALDHDLAPLERLVTARVNEVAGLCSLSRAPSNAVGAAASCKDGQPAAVRPRRTAGRAQSAVPPRTRGSRVVGNVSAVFSAMPGLHTGIDAGRAAPTGRPTAPRHDRCAAMPQRPTCPSSRSWATAHQHRR